jgi:hypothetical protein
MGQELNSAAMLTSDFASLSDLIRAHAVERPDKPAMICEDRAISYAALDTLLDRIAAALQREGLARSQAVAILAATSIEYGCVFLGALRAGGVPAPLQPSATPAQLAAMIADCGAPMLFLDAMGAKALGDAATAAKRIALDGSEAGTPLADFLAPEGSTPAPVTVTPDDPFNIIYSSGTTGTPKGIVQPQRCAGLHISRAPGGFGERGDDGRHPALFEHHAGQLHPDDRLGRHRGAARQVRRARIRKPGREASRHPRHARPGPVSADHGAARFRQIRPVQLRLQDLHQRALLPRAQGRHPRALARAAGRILRHDRGRRHHRAGLQRQSRQAPHRRRAAARP